MQFNKNHLKSIFVYVLIITASIVSAKNLKSEDKNNDINLVRDLYPSAPGVSLVQGALKVTTTGNYGNYGLSAPSPVVHSYASNTSSAPNLGGYGRTAEIISKINSNNFRPPSCFTR